MQTGEPATMLLHERCAIGPNNVGHLQRWPDCRSPHLLLGYVQIAGGGFQAAVAQKDQLGLLGKY